MESENQGESVKEFVPHHSNQCRGWDSSPGSSELGVYLFLDMNIGALRQS